MEKYCAYQERCHQEVRNKLLKVKVYGDDLEDIMSHLVQQGFLNEERFARAFARGKFRIKQWGRQRITNELKLRNISDYCIRKAMTEIDEDTYQTVALEVANKLRRRYNTPLDYKLKHKIKGHLIRKGFEYEVVNNIVDHWR